MNQTAEGMYASAGTSPTPAQLASALADADELTDWDISTITPDGPRMASFQCDDGQYEYVVTVRRVGRVR